MAAGKTSAAYQVHSYPTKIPPEAIVPFLEAYTGAGDIVLDPFCGSGMTGVACLRLDRRPILSDLSPGAVHVSQNMTHPVDPIRLDGALADLDRAWMSRRERDLYSIPCPTCLGPGIARHTIWSEVVGCPACSYQVVLWDLRNSRGQIPKETRCPSCAVTIRRAGAKYIGSVPVQVTVDCASGCMTLQTGPIRPQDAHQLEQISRRRPRHWIPKAAIAVDREMYRRSALHLKSVETVADFYLPRAKHALSGLWAALDRISEADIRGAMRLAFTNTAWHASRMRRYNAHGGQRPLTGTLYIPQLVAEANVFEVFRHQVRQIGRYFEQVDGVPAEWADVRRSSATDLSWLASSSVDYVFTDPPFGGNLFYGDCNVVWESWLGDVTDTDSEIVVNRCKKPDEGGKTVDDYGHLLAAAFAEIKRVLRPVGRASVVFHNSDDQVWKVMLEAAEQAGLRQVEVSLLDKVQRSMKGYKGRSGKELVPFFDLVITFAPGPAPVPRLNGAGEVALEVLRAHLGSSIDDRERSLEYLYSLTLAELVRQGVPPVGLSLRAFEELCDRHFQRAGNYYGHA